MNLQYNIDDTIVAMATPPGIGAIGVIRVSGKDAIAITQAVFSGKDLNTQPSHTLHLGKIISPAENNEIVDEVLVSLFRGPHSYTGEDCAEISGHGSPFVLQRIVEILIHQGARHAAAGEFTFRAFIHKKLDLSQAEAVADLIAADNKGSQTTALQQLRGGYSARFQALRQELINFASLIELELDFGEEDVEFANRSELKNLVNKILAEIKDLSDSFQFGNALKNGVPVAIVGAPNAGKSTLLNVLLNEDRAIVSDIPGTTRDTIEEVLHFKGIAFRFIDTAGIRQTENTIEAIGVKRAYEKVQLAGIVLLMFDVTNTKPEELEAQIKELNVPPTAKLVCIGNKIDLINERSILDQFQKFEPVFMTTGNYRDIAHLKEKLPEMIMESRNPGNGVIVSNARHYEALMQASNYLQKALYNMDKATTGDLLAFDIRKALYHLGEITGEVTTDDLLGNIFGKFCIGK
jgi:tRNA modification GTPase